MKKSMSALTLLRAITIRFRPTFRLLANLPSLKILFLASASADWAVGILKAKAITGLTTQGEPIGDSLWTHSRIYRLRIDLEKANRSRLWNKGRKKREH